MSNPIIRVTLAGRAFEVLTHEDVPPGVIAVADEQEMGLVVAGLIAAGVIKLHSPDNLTMYPVAAHKRHPADAGPPTLAMPQRLAMRDDVIAAVSDSNNGLNTYQRDLLRRRWGIGGAPMSLVQIASLFNTTQNQVNLQIREALRMARVPMKHPKKVK